MTPRLWLPFLNGHLHRIVPLEVFLDLLVVPFPHLIIAVPASTTIVLAESSALPFYPEMSSSFLKMKLDIRNIIFLGAIKIFPDGYSDALTSFSVFICIFSLTF